ncbi:MAG: lysophospholipid acyltransferase family protein [Sedimentisphaerales bacterium]
MAEEQRQRKRHKRKPTIVEQWLVYVLLRIFLFFVFLFPVEKVLKFACFWGKGFWKHYHRGRQRAIDNLKASFPDKDDEWIEQTGIRSFERLLMFAVDVVFIPRLVKKENWEQYSRYKNVERVKWMMAGKQPLLLVTGHYGNFEIIGYLLGEFGFDIYSIARPFDNRFLNKYLYDVRQRKGQKIIDKKGAAEQMEEIIRQGSTLCFVADQNAGKKGVFVDFFGRKASTYKSIGLLAIQYNLPIGVGVSRRVDNRFFFEIEMARLIMPEEWKDKEDPLLWITQEYTKAFEESIRKDPTQYWWLHNRWKTRPRDEKI